MTTNSASAQGITGHRSNRPMSIVTIIMLIGALTAFVTGCLGTASGSLVLSAPQFLLAIGLVVAGTARQRFRAPTLTVGSREIGDISPLRRVLLIAATGLYATNIAFLLASLPVEPRICVSVAVLMMGAVTGIALARRWLVAIVVTAVTFLPGAYALFEHGTRIDLFIAGMLAASVVIVSALAFSLHRLIATLVSDRSRELRRSQALQDARERLLTLSQQHHYEFDLDFRVVNVSNGMSEFYGAPYGEILGRTVDSFLTRAPQSASFRKTVRQAVESAQAFIDVESVVHRRDGPPATILTSGIPVFGEDGKLEGYCAWFTDVTEARERELNMRESEARFRDFATLAAECLWEVDEHWRYRMVLGNSACVMGSDDTEVLGRRCVLADPEIQRPSSALVDALRRRLPFTDIITVLPNGNVISSSGVPRHDEDGKFVGYRGYSKDVTTEQQALVEAETARTELQAQNETLEKRIRERTAEIESYTNLVREVLETILEGVLVLDPDGRIEFMNGQAPDLLPPGEWKVGTAIAETLQDIGADAEIVQRAIANGREFSEDYVTADQRQVRLVCKPRKTGGFVVTLLDRTADLNRVDQLRVLSEELRSSIMEAEAATEAKSMFLANMSHEIRTPMNGVLGMADILLGTELDTEQRERVEVLKRCGENLLTIINDILDFSKLEADKMQLSADPFDAGDCIRDVMELIEPIANRKGLELTSDIPANLHSVVGDQGRFRQVLTNLTGNAVKFTDQGAVHLHVAAEAIDDLVTMRIGVTDTGCGIPPDRLEAIFNTFEQVDNSASRTHEGTGLGLAISQRIAVLMKGNITARSEVGKGSTFEFTVCLPKAETAEEPTDLVDPSLTEPVIPRSGNARILVAEDNEVNRMVVKAMLAETGYQVIFASDGQQAVDAARDGDFDLILMDVSMPRLDGYEATRAIRNFGSPRGTVPIVGVTAHAMAGDERRCLDAGMDAYLRKPISRPLLLAEIEEHLNPRLKLVSNAG